MSFNDSVAETAALISFSSQVLDSGVKLLEVHYGKKKQLGKMLK